MNRRILTCKKVIQVDSIMHYGMPRRSGRYPWGSGDDPYQHTPGFYSRYLKLKSEGLDDKTIAAGMGLSMAQLKDLNYWELSNQGLSQKEIADKMGLSTTDLRNYITVAKAYGTVDDVAQCWALKNKGYSNVAIAQKLGVTEGTVRNLLQPGADKKAKETLDIINAIKSSVDEKGVVDVGTDVERYLHITKTKFDACVSALEDEGYHLYYATQIQSGTGLPTTIKALTKPDIQYYGEGGFKERFAYDPSIVKSIGLYADDVGDKIETVKPPVSIDRSRIFVRYGDQGGSEKDGLIELRPGIEDIDLLDSRYSQVRIAVDGGKYMKGMAIRSDGIPEGYDIVYNTNKPTGASDEKVFKTQKEGESPFGAIVYQKEYVGADGKTHQSALNIVNDEGEWGTWSKNLPSQFLSKQSPDLVKQQLGVALQASQDEFDRIMSLTNPTVRKKLLQEYADGADADAMHLKAAAMPRQRTQVILPVPELSENEIYAPNFNDGERVVLVRFPHAGPFESPELVVNNKNPSAKKLIGQALDAVGINARVAEKMSGADFDGDNVLVIPNNNGAIKTAKSLPLLDGFDPKVSFPLPAGHPDLEKDEKKRTEIKNNQMGRVSNLITDMYLKNADPSELARAVAHSMVVIDSVKHDLDWKASEEYYGINELKKKYQEGGASTIVSRAKNEAHPVKMKELTSTQGMTPEELEAWNRGERVFRPTGETKKVRITDPAKMTPDERKVYESGKKVWRETDIPVRMTTTQMALAKDASELSSGTIVEQHYVDYANGMKNLANQARAAARSTPNLQQSPSAKQTYASQVESLSAKLNAAEMNRPRERQAQMIAASQVNQMKRDNPDMSRDEEKKARTRATERARNAVGANKKAVRVDITPIEWEAIQAGAISDSMLSQILANTDMDKVRNYAMPRESKSLSASEASRIVSMYNRGMTYADIAAAVGVSVSAVQSAVSNK